MLKAISRECRVVGVVAIELLRISAIAKFLCFISLLVLGCSDDLTTRNQKLYDFVNESCVEDAKIRQSYRCRISLGEIHDCDRMKLIRECAEKHRARLQEILMEYRSKVRLRRGPYRTSRMINTADSGLVNSLEEMIYCYDALIKCAATNENCTLEQISRNIGYVNWQKRNFYERAAQLRLSSRKKKYK